MSRTFEVNPELNTFCPSCGKTTELGRKQHCGVSPILRDEHWFPVHEDGKYVGYHSNITSKLIIDTRKGMRVME